MYGVVAVRAAALSSGAIAAALVVAPVCAVLALGVRAARVVACGVAASASVAAVGVAACGASVFGRLVVAAACTVAVAACADVVAYRPGFVQEREGPPIYDRLSLIRKEMAVCLRGPPCLPAAATAVHLGVECMHHHALHSWTAIADYECPPGI